MKNTFDSTLIRCSSLGHLFVEPRDKAAKERGDLSETAKGHLYEVYGRELWGIEPEIRATAIKKGKLLELDGIRDLSLHDKKFYTKNDERKDNEWITGECDVDNEPYDEIIDVKVALDAMSFLPNIMSGVDRMHEIQLQGYMWLWNRSKARVSHILLSMPDSMIEGEKYSLLRYMDCATEENDLFKAAWAKRLTNLKFDHIPMNERIISHYLTRNEEIISRIPQKVAKAREYLQQLFEKHMAASSK